jgi:hypothetical protein
VLIVFRRNAPPHEILIDNQRTAVGRTSLVRPPEVVKCFALARQGPFQL